MKSHARALFRKHFVSQRMFGWTEVASVGRLRADVPVEAVLSGMAKSMVEHMRRHGLVEVWGARSEPMKEGGYLFLATRAEFPAAQRLMAQRPDPLAAKMLWGRVG